MRPSDWLSFICVVFGAVIALKLFGLLTDGGATRVTIIAAMCVIVRSVNRLTAAKGDA